MPKVHYYIPAYTETIQPSVHVPQWRRKPSGAVVLQTCALYMPYWDECTASFMTPAARAPCDAVLRRPERSRPQAKPGPALLTGRSLVQPPSKIKVDSFNSRIATRQCQAAGENICILGRQALVRFQVQSLATVVPQSSAAVR